LFTKRVEPAKVKAVGKLGAVFQFPLVLQLLFAPRPVQVDCAGEYAGINITPLMDMAKSSEPGFGVERWRASAMTAEEDRRTCHVLAAHGPTYCWSVLLLIFFGY
jgi:hypothetical protein